jgi:hypothetical protein
VQRRLRCRQGRRAQTPGDPPSLRGVGSIAARRVRESIYRSADLRWDPLRQAVLSSLPAASAAFSTNPLSLAPCPELAPMTASSFGLGAENYRKLGKKEGRRPNMESRRHLGRWRFQPKASRSSDGLCAAECPRGHPVGAFPLNPTAVRFSVLEPKYAENPGLQNQKSGVRVLPAPLESG